MERVRRRGHSFHPSFPLFLSFRILDFVQHQRGLEQEVVVVLAVFVVHHHEAGGIVGGRFRHDLPVGDGVQPVFEVVGAQIAAIVLKTDHYGKLVEGEQIIRFLIQLFLQVYDIVPSEIDPGAFAEEYVAPAVEGDDIPEPVFFEVLEHEVFDRHLGGAELLEGILQLPLIEPEIFPVGFPAVRPHIDHFFYPPDSMSQFIYLGGNAHDVHIRVVDPGLDENLVGSMFKDQEAYFTNRVEIGVTAVNIAIL